MNSASPIRLPDSWMPRVSVVMPAYNSERYIGAAICSALVDGGTDVEVIVVDDGSKDSTVGVARGLNDPRITVIPITASGGPSRPRNVGVAHARAAYVSLLDSDDLLKPGKLASSVAALEACPTAGFVFGDFERMDADGNVFETSMTYAYPVFRGLKWRAVGPDWRLIEQPELARGLLYENFVGTSGVVVRKHLVTALGGFDETLSNGDDLDLWFRLAHHADAVFLPRIGHSYRIHATSVVHGPPIRNASARLTVLHRERTRWSDPVALRQLNQRIAENFAVIGYQQRLLGKRLAAMRAYLDAYRNWPKLRWLAYLVLAAMMKPEGSD